MLVLASAGGVLGQLPERLRTGDLKTLQDAFAGLADRVRPSVVAIRTYQHSGGAAERADDSGSHGLRIPESQGSGVIFRAEGYILTNHHVVEDSDEIDVVLANGDDVPGKLLQSDPRSDLAVIRVERANLRAAALGDLSRVRQGQWTFAFGNPFGMANQNGRTSFTVGNVSALDRQLTQQLDPRGRKYYGNLIETTSAINPGNSGGPLFNLDGEVIGVVTAIESRTGVNEGIGFAIPICGRTRKIIDTLAAGEKVHYGYLGIDVQDVPESLRRAAGAFRNGGAMVGLVYPDSAASQADLRREDIIVEYDGVAVEGADHLVRLVGSTPVGASTAIKFVRGGHTESATVQLGDRELAVAAQGGERDGPPAGPARKPAEQGPTIARWMGALLAEPTEEHLRDLKLAREDAGIVVLDVKRPSRAFAAGLRAEQLIMRFDGKRIHSLEEFAAAAERAGKHIRLELSDHKVVYLRDD